MPISNPRLDGNVDTYAMTKELKNKAFRINSQNKKRAIDKEVTFISEIKLQKEHFLSKRHCLLGDLRVHFEPLLGWKCTYICHHQAIEKEGRTFFSQKTLSFRQVLCPF